MANLHYNTKTIMVAIVNMGYCNSVTAFTVFYISVCCFAYRLHCSVRNNNNNNNNNNK